MKARDLRASADRWEEFLSKLLAGVGPLTALGTVRVLGLVERFPDAMHVTSYVGLIPEEESSGDRQRFGRLTQQGHRLLRFLLVEAAQTASRFDPGLRRTYRRLAFRKGAASAKVAVARKLALRLYISWWGATARPGARIWC